jgi:DASH complex subunit DAD4
MKLRQDKTTELVVELNQALEQIIRANQSVRVATQLTTKYRKNVEYNLKMQELSDKKSSTSNGL